VFVIYKPGSSLNLDKKFLIENQIIFSSFEKGHYPLIKIETMNANLLDRFKAQSDVLELFEGPNYILASKKISAAFNAFSIGNTQISEDKIVVIAGPCSVTDDGTLMRIASRVRSAGASIIRGGIFKPRTSPYVFQGIGEAGLGLVDEVEKSGLPFVSEVMSEEQIEILSPHVSALQVGARNMQNFNLLKALGRQDLPVVLKQGFGCTLIEFLNAAEYILSGGNDKVALVIRGIRSFENVTRFTLDLGAIAFLKQESRLPIIVDPSHATGRADLIASTAKGAIAAGADGLMLEVHSDPATSISDADQALSLEDFDTLMQQLDKIAGALGKTIVQSPVVRLEESS